MKVLHLQLTEALFVPGLPQFQRTMTSTHYPGIDMELHPLGVKCSFKGVTFLVNNFQCAVLEEKTLVKKTTKES